MFLLYYFFIFCSYVFLLFHLFLQAVVLTENLYPFRESETVSAYVKIINATSVRVTQGFLAAWLGIASVGLDLWNCGTVNLVTAPPVDLRVPRVFKTFVG